MSEGIPNYPDWSRWWQIVDKYKVNIFYTAPTAIRAMMREGDGPVKKTSRKTLKLLGTVGEPINPEAWQWYFKTVGDSRCPIVDTWWQTETGGILISAQPGAIDLKPGSATKPFYGIRPVIVDEKGKVVQPKVKTTTNKKFNQAAITAIKQWKFKPAVKDGRRVKTRWVVPFNFKTRTA